MGTVEGESARRRARVIRNREVALAARVAFKVRMRQLEVENGRLGKRRLGLEEENGVLRGQIEVVRSFTEGAKSEEEGKEQSERRYDGEEEGRGGGGTGEVVGMSVQAGDVFAEVKLEDNPFFL